MPQTHPITGEVVHRWHVQTNAGRKTTWAASAGAAQKKVEAKGFTVERVTTASDPLVNR